jgi:hypothetical protein
VFLISIESSGGAMSVSFLAGMIRFFCGGGLTTVSSVVVDVGAIESFFMTESSTACAQTDVDEKANNKKNKKRRCIKHP